MLLRHVVGGWRLTSLSVYVEVGGGVMAALLELVAASPVRSPALKFALVLAVADIAVETGMPSGQWKK